MGIHSPLKRKIGILGGGQLGRMMIQAGLDLNLDFKVIDPDALAPCHALAEFYTGSLTDYDTVMDFGKDCDILTIEIENVNADALEQLERLGKKVYPQPKLIRLIQDKGLQKEFYKAHGIPTASFTLFENRSEVMRNGFAPAVNKLRREGYDGRGVKVIHTEDNLAEAFDAPSILEEKVIIEKEIAVLLARNEEGAIVTYPVVEMEFNPQHHMVEVLFAPARISPSLAETAESIAKKVITEMELVGILAIEMFITPDGKILVNEMAPRPHNSGHHTIEANMTSQFAQHLRAILGIPFGSTQMVNAGIMINILGEEGYSGPVVYDGLEKVLSIDGAFVHLYGKMQTKPHRKMGHVTLVGSDIDSLKMKANFVKQTLKAIS